MRLPRLHCLGVVVATAAPSPVHAALIPDVLPAAYSDVPVFVFLYPILTALVTPVSRREPSDKCACTATPLHLASKGDASSASMR